MKKSAVFLGSWIPCSIGVTSGSLDKCCRCELLARGKLSRTDMDFPGFVVKMIGMKWVRHAFPVALRSCRVALLAASVSAGLAAGDRSASLLGQAAPEWQQPIWLDGKPRELADLRGEVILIRWWTAPGCPYCRATAPALNEFARKYRERGLLVFGFYHHKSPEALRLGDVTEHARRLGLDFPIAVDPEWRTLKRWWLNSGDRQWTSVSFLLDRRGIVRYIHRGGQYVKGDEDYAVLQAKIEELLAETKS